MLLNSKISSIKEDLKKRINQRRKSYIYVFLNQIITLLFGFVGFLFLVRTLSKDDFGIWVLFLAVSVFIDMGRNGFIQNAFIKFYVNAKTKEKKSILSSSLLINIIISFSAIVLLNLSSDLLVNLWNSDKFITLFLFHSISVMVSVLFSQVNFLFQALSDFKSYFIINFIKHLFSFIGIILFCLTSVSDDLYFLVLFQSAGILAGGIIGYILSKEHFIISLKFYKNWFTKQIQYGKYVLGTALSSILFNNIDTMMLGVLIGPAASALYNLAFRITNLVEIPISTFSLVVFPVSAEKIKTEGSKAVKDIYEKSVASILAIILPATFLIFIFAEEIILIIAGQEYLDSVTVLRIVLVFTLLKPFLRQFGTSLDAIGKPEINFYTIVVITLLNALFNYLFINTYGLLGAAYATLLTLTVGVIISNILLTQELKTSVRKILQNIISTYGSLGRLINKTSQMKQQYS